MDHYLKIGKLVASFGFKGDMILLHGLGKKTSLKGLEKFFIEESKGSFIPYFPENSSAKSETETIIKIEGINSKESTRLLLQKEIWLTAADFEKFGSASSPISFLGYSIYEGKSFIGEIIELIEQPHQLLCKVIYQGKEALIPLHEESLIEIDKKKKMIFVQLPDGLLDIYLQ